MPRCSSTAWSSSRHRSRPCEPAVPALLSSRSEIKGDSMRLARLVLTAGLVTIIVLLPGVANAAESHIGLHEMNCTGITAMGKGLAPNAMFRVALVDQQRGRTLVRETVRTDGDGMFLQRLKTKLYDTLSVGLTFAAQDGKLVGFPNHTMAAGSPMCNLP